MVYINGESFIKVPSKIDDQGSGSYIVAPPINTPLPTNKRKSQLYIYSSINLIKIKFHIFTIEMKIDTLTNSIQFFYYFRLLAHQFTQENIIYIQSVDNYNEHIYIYMIA